MRFDCLVPCSPSQSVQTKVGAAMKLPPETLKAPFSSIR
ncbi:hypothetical protein F442_07269 [Phytophthora nicotianae P10297]|uniref:Uncharacterized protein n=2 Tax=Phytophthora nicotianae TaxID=4792 RepID=V9FEF9_PHYNI|nr:hypothetical protein F443_07202 [Phytophthora nicotianae P1569]ETP46490.1 hypothetical protein F442_07269 [Phytophthora nicotianae P10297]